MARFGDRFDAQGVLSGSKDANRCIGYLTKYLTKQVADCHCPMLRPDPAQRGRLEEIRDNLLDRIAEAEHEGWAGEAEGLRISLTGVRDKLSQIATPRPVNLGMPAFHEITGRHNQPADKPADTQRQRQHTTA